MDEYEKLLIKQFISATGIKNDNSARFYKKFKIWLENIKILNEKYLDVLCDMNFDYNKAYCAEIGKGKDDSVVYNTSNTTIITPYGSDMFDAKNRIITSKLFATNAGKLNINTKLITIPEITTFMTQNPYKLYDLGVFSELHNGGKKIIVGVFGNNEDKDIVKKSKQIQNLKCKLDGNYTSMCGLTEGFYFSVVATKVI